MDLLLSFGVEITARAVCVKKIKKINNNKYHLSRKTVKI